MKIKTNKIYKGAWCLGFAVSKYLVWPFAPELQRWQIAIELKLIKYEITIQFYRKNNAA